MIELVQTYWLYFLIGQYPNGPLGGLALTVGILIDALLVRTLLAPALLTIFGRASGWPGHRLDPPQSPPPAEEPTDEEPSEVGARS